MSGNRNTGLEGVGSGVGGGKDSTKSKDETGREIRREFAQSRMSSGTIIMPDTQKIITLTTIHRCLAYWLYIIFVWS